MYDRGFICILLGSSLVCALFAAVSVKHVNSCHNATTAVTRAYSTGREESITHLMAVTMQSMWHTYLKELYTASPAEMETQVVHRRQGCT